MQLFSTNESINVKRVSALAILETIISIVSLLFLSKYDSSRYIFILASIAPFGLLRNAKSIARGLSYLEYYEGNDALRGAFKNFVRILFLVVFCWGLQSGTLLKHWSLLTFLAIAYYVGHFWIIRILATGYVLFSDPLKSISGMAGNWRRIVFCEDMTTQPVYLPGYYYGPRELANQIVGGPPERILGRIIHSVNYWMLFIQAFLFANIFRFSVKATCILFWPFLAFSKSATITSRSTAKAFSSFRSSDTSRIRVGFSIFMIFLLVAKLSLVSSLTKISVIRDKEEAQKIAIENSFKEVFDLSMKIGELELFAEYFVDENAKIWAKEKIQTLKAAQDRLIYSESAGGVSEFEGSLELAIWRWWGASPTRELAREYLALHKIPWWQVASAINSIIFLAMWSYAGTYSNLDKSPNLLGRPKASGRLWLGGCVASLILSLYVFECNLAILWRFENPWSIVTAVWNSIDGWFPTR
jgi:hypothetical protein